MNLLNFHKFTSYKSTGIFSNNTLFINELLVSPYGGVDLTAIVQKFFTDNPTEDTFNVFFIITQYQNTTDKIQEFIKHYGFECIYNFTNEKTSNELYLYEVQFNRNNMK